jgi:hypothetical protein
MVYFGSMKTTIDIPEKDLKEVIKYTGAKTKKQAILTAVTKYNRLQRLAALNARIRGTFKDFMTQEDLKIMREDAKWEAMK